MGRLGYAFKVSMASIRKDRFSTFAVVVGMSLGITAFAFSFGAFERQRVDLERLSLPRSIVNYFIGNSNSGFPFRPQDAKAWLEELKADGYRSCAYYSSWFFWPEEKEGEMENLYTLAAVDPETPQMLGLKTVDGSLFARQDYEQGTAVCILGWNAYRRLKRLGAGTVGQNLCIFQKDFRVIGILHPDHSSVFLNDVLIPFPCLPSNRVKYMDVFTKLERPMQAKRLERKWKDFFTKIKNHYPKGCRPELIGSLPPHETSFFYRIVNEISFFLAIVPSHFGVGCLLLFVAGLNLAGFAAARVARRRREIAIRKALGANAGHIYRDIAAIVN